MQSSFHVAVLDLKVSTDLFRKAEDGDILGEPVLTIGGNHILPLLLGDGAYPLLRWLLKPYANNVALNPTQQHYSRVFFGVFSSARVVVQRAFGALKGRWRILLKILGCLLYTSPSPRDA